MAPDNDFSAGRGWFFERKTDGAFHAASGQPFLQSRRQSVQVRQWRVSGQIQRHVQSAEGPFHETANLCRPTEQLSPTTPLRGDFLGFYCVLSEPGTRTTFAFLSVAPTNLHGSSILGESKVQAQLRRFSLPE